MSLNSAISIVAVLLHCVAASNILVWNPRLGLSHVNLMGNIADVLTADGHNVTIYSIPLDPDIKTFGNRLPAHTILFKSNVTIDWLKLNMKSASVWDAPPCDGMCFEWSDITKMMDHMFNLCRDLLQNEKLLDVLRSSKFDLVFSELFDACAPGIWKLIGIKDFIVVSSTGMLPGLYEIVGMPMIASFMPVGLTPYSDKMTFFERMTNFNIQIFLRFFGYKLEKNYWTLFNEKHPGFPRLSQLYDERIALIMTNVNEFTETARPTTNMIKYIGGSAVRDPKPLSQELNDLLNKNPTTVLFSMGSLVQSKDMPDWLKKDVIETFASFPNITFIWKYESDDYNDEFRKHPNIYPMKWIPQIDLLADPRLTVFITHGGMNSILEGMNLGKPMIVIPVFADQQVNSKNVVRNGLGVVIERHLLNRETLTNALNQVIGNREISQKVDLVASLLEGRPKQYRQDIARWAKIIIRHGQMDHLKLYSRKLNWIQYYSLDVIAFELSLVLSVISLAVWIVLRICVNIRTRKVKSE